MHTLPHPTWQLVTGLFKKTALLLFCLLLLANKHAGAQSDAHYFSVSYIKLKPNASGKDYESQLSYFTKKLLEYRVKQGEINGWSLWKVIMPMGTQSDYDYEVVVSSKSMQTLLDDTLVGADYKAAMPDMDENVRGAIGDQLNSLRSVVKRDVLNTYAETDMSTAMPKYIQVDYMKAAPGKVAAYLKMEKETFMPVHKERIKMGVMSDWEVDQLVLPVQANSPYDAVTGTFFSDLSYITNGKAVEAFKTVWPKMDMDKLMPEVNATRTIVKSDILKLISSVNAHTMQ